MTMVNPSSSPPDTVTTPSSSLPSLASTPATQTTTTAAPSAPATAPTAAAPSSSFPRTFYRRQLPSTCISFSSSEGRAVFASAMANGGTYSFFPLIEQLQTQPEPAYCGLTTLVIVLNALAVDPRRSWKGPWRWYEESMLNCCVDLEEVKKTGITFTTFAYLAKCQGLNVNAVYGSDSNIEQFRHVVRQTCTHATETTISTTNNNTQEQEQRPTSFLIVTYMRKVLGQTGTGHFSPIGAYDESSDHVLILDTARFKYGPHWVPLELVFEALLPLDPDTEKSRGYMVLGYNNGVAVDGLTNANGESNGTKGVLPQLPLSRLFGSQMSKNYLRREYKNYLRGLEKGVSSLTELPQLPLSRLFGSQMSKNYLRREYKNYLRGLETIKRLDGGSGALTLSDVISFWTKDNTDYNHIWELVEPQLQPVCEKDIQMVESMRQLVKDLIRASGEHETSVPCDMLLTSRERAEEEAKALALKKKNKKKRGSCCKSKSTSLRRSCGSKEIIDAAANLDANANGASSATNMTSNTNNANNHHSGSSSSCGCALEISPAEVLYIIYLASLPLHARHSIVYKTEYKTNVVVKGEAEIAYIEADDTTREQILAEAALISYGIETSDVKL
eukprot:CAMPEP_0183743178 /NCGR_PEP_ID=MMETSP0737-20130205/65081_1 /TAXON_ID=385413 /ORGANISM="Thalassiosira miniscula, Strain CCMP1093" /LENGTH=615 /DNA_ID=CAMNT_0025978787 /DNA_START=169 /DNA_END=2017 /DNA_ORIENTATION=-